jgi:hypothetical protein
MPEFALGNQLIKGVPMASEVGFKLRSYGRGGRVAKGVRA